MSENPQIHSDGVISWTNDYGQIHKEDGPAILLPSGAKFWFINGRLHREDGPAVEHSTGTLEWYKHDKLHRLDGPAIEHSDGDKSWWYNNTKVECTSQEEFERLIELEIFW